MTGVRGEHVIATNCLPLSIAFNNLLVCPSLAETPTAAVRAHVLPTMPSMRPIRMHASVYVSVEKFKQCRDKHTIHITSIYLMHFADVAEPKSDWKPEELATVGELLLDISIQLART